ncbi:MAG: hypothetical protein COC01_09395 [Bacteroidetes bacterium]|nr:MAG: hypothetical protein COC01_09395 [Bacteroidota bacterium]
MPKLLIIGKFVFTIFSADIEEKRRHVHIISKKGRKYIVAKIWLEPNIEVEKTGNFSKEEINTILKLIEENSVIINEQLDLFYKGEKVKSIKLK